MDAYRFLSRCGQLATGAARELVTGLQTFGAALIGAPLPPEAFPSATPPAGRPATTGGPGRPASRVRPGGLRAGAEAGAPPAGHPERLIPHVPPTPAERRLWSQLG